MPLLSTDRSRVAALVVSLGLIGGTGCITSSIISAEKQKAVQRENERKHAALIAQYKPLAAQGDLEASVKLAQEYLNPYFRDSRDVPAALQLLQRASDQQYGPAEYMYGWLLLTGNLDSNTFMGNVVIQNPERGIELLRRAAGRQCSYQRPVTWVEQREIAYSLGEFFRRGAYVSRNIENADLWLARSLIHCQYPDAPRLEALFYPRKEITSQALIETLAWMSLAPDHARTQKLRNSMSADDVQMAMRRAKELRSIVRESERQIPAPSKATQP